MNTQKCLSDADLGRLWEGDTTPQEKQVLQQHIETCPDCKKRWQRMSAGARHVEQLFLKAADRSSATGQCLSTDLLKGYIGQSLGSEQVKTIEEHLTLCSRCRDVLADKFFDSYVIDGENWWSQYVGRQILSLLARLPHEEIDELLEASKVTPAVSLQSGAVIKLPVLEPVEGEARRLAAATGEGFSEQTLHQEEPPFVFELVQFGEQVQITARPQQENSPYENCLARLELCLDESCIWSQVILVNRGEGQSVLEPEDARRLRPQQQHLTIRLQPLVSLEQLSSAGSGAFMPILRRLLKHKDPEIRYGAVEVVGRICGTEARSMIEPLAEDEDEKVRLAVKKLVGQLPKNPG